MKKTTFFIIIFFMYLLTLIFLFLYNQGLIQGAATAANAAPEIAHINFHSWVFASKNAMNKILKPDRE